MARAVRGWIVWFAALACGCSAPRPAVVGETTVAHSDSVEVSAARVHIANAESVAGQLAEVVRLEFDSTGRVSAAECRRIRSCVRGRVVAVDSAGVSVKAQESGELLASGKEVPAAGRRRYLWWFVAAAGLAAVWLWVRRSYTRARFGL